MAFINLLRFVVTVSALTVACSQTLANGNYHIKNVRDGTLAHNLNGATPPTLISFRNFSSVEASNFVWKVSKGAGDSGFTLTNVGSGNTAAVTNEEDAQVSGFANITTQFAIESAGNGDFVIKSPNADLLWDVITDLNFKFGFSFVPFLEPASGGDAEKFQFIAV
ncbi:hypothetical protein D9619_003831 [Psilocybe cf. subviscida]|uniref:Ricin B lectin domain-containing protein n=1 Tax=Psilocybe cf. subviscida TaxID=2480587 RepID=A0A8H5AXX8_9AGAR|nr:hypothetical protein D9619_003831 [Psilocybe cf. subviscida]